jgi:uracil-DNA glycosylase
MAAQGAAGFVPDTDDLAELAAAAQGCKGCDLYLDATQTVFGAGSPTADIMLVGEQPGDQEDRAGLPFVGPAGRLLDKALAAAAIDRDRLYVTNAVKHFKFTLSERGKRRIHKTPSRTEVVACRPWLFAELKSVRPDVVVLLGAIAAQSLLGSSFGTHPASMRRLTSRSTPSWWPPCIRRRCCADRPRIARRRLMRWFPICGLPPDCCPDRASSCRCRAVTITWSG